MLYFTQLIYIKDGQEEIFHQFESIVLPLLKKYRGRLLLRVRPGDDAFIEYSIEKPYEIHLVEFENEEDFKSYSKDEERTKFLHLKEQSIKASVLFKGEKISF